ncbi:MAG: SPOR domain-containing protein [Gammaproteobacteria bacterium]|jgi:DedD protein|nr:SPOR domain-containing protein [Gammaproteobacteria bacterium]
MEAPLQQRIVGAIVLVTLGVIFIPALLDGSGYRSRQVQDIEIKEKPEFPPLTQKKVQPIPTPLATNRQQQVKVQNADPGQAHKKPIKSFALQVGTFDSNENAEKMRDQMRAAGYTAFVHKSTSKGKSSYKVRVGPELERSVLEKIKSDLKKSRKIDAYVVNHP